MSKHLDEADKWSSGHSFGEEPANLRVAVRCIIAHLRETESRTPAAVAPGQAAGEASDDPADLSGYLAIRGPKEFIDAIERFDSHFGKWLRRRFLPPKESQSAG